MGAHFFGGLIFIVGSLLVGIAGGVPIVVRSCSVYTVGCKGGHIFLFPLGLHTFSNHVPCRLWDYSVSWHYQLFGSRKT